MPTRIVLKENNPPSRLAATGLTEDEERTIRDLASPATPPRIPKRQSALRNSSSQRRVVGFRSSILRDVSTRQSSNVDDPSYEEEVLAADEAAQQRRLQLHLSNEDIRSSPRLLGYLFGGIASTVMLVSVVQFYLAEEENYYITQQSAQGRPYNQTQFPDDEYFHTITGPVYVWKLYCCMAIAAAGTLGFLIILIMHFDTVCFPRVWFQFFRDGSLAERNLLICLLVFWAVSLHVNTSSFSVGEMQPNVYFTTWIVFICMALNVGVWRESAGLPRLVMKILLHHRETTYNWCWTLVFALITAGASTDMYFHRDQISLRLKGEILALSWGDWMRVLSLVWAEVFVCMVAILCNHIWSAACKLNCPGGCRFVLNWRFLEGLIILVIVGFNFWIILEYTGVYGVINGMNNVYYGIWGTFFNIVFTFGTWLRENKDIDYII